MTKIAGWGNHPRRSTTTIRAETIRALKRAIVESEHILPTGNHHSYGDASLADTILDMRRLDRILHFDEKHGVLKAEAGITLDALLEVIVPRGWFLAITPGTKHVTLGGCIAGNVHGKNHHRIGSFANSLVDCTIMLADGEAVVASRSRRPDLFFATLGGMGLTGVICEATIRLRKIPSSYADAQHLRCENLTDLLSVLERTDKRYEYTVAWIDSSARGEGFGRGIVMAGNHSTRGNLSIHKTPRITIPRIPRILHPPLIRLFNTLYYQISRSGERRVHYDAFFYPLDKINAWNRLYGKNGFIQYQCALPNPDALRKILATLSASKTASPLTILKRMQKEDLPLGFALEGYTLAIDLPTSPDAQRLIDELDVIVERAGGRINLTKDSQMSAAFFARSYPHIETWKAVKHKYDPNRKFTSDLARRLGL